LPYAAALRLAQEDADFDPEIVVARVPSDRLGEFSYATEHVTHDGAVGALLACAQALERAKEHLEGALGSLPALDQRPARRGLDHERTITRAGGRRFALSVSTGGVFLARHIEAGRRENKDPWPAEEKMFRDPQSMLPKELSGEIPAPLRAAWKQVQQTDRLALLRLLARFEITPDQARVLYEPSERAGAGIDCTDHDILTDPYRSPSLHSPPEKRLRKSEMRPLMAFSTHWRWLSESRWCTMPRRPRAGRARGGLPVEQRGRAPGDAGGPFGAASRTPAGIRAGFRGALEIAAGQGGVGPDSAARADGAALGRRGFSGTPGAAVASGAGAGEGRPQAERRVEIRKAMW